MSDDWFKEKLGKQAKNARMLEELFDGEVSLYLTAQNDLLSATPGIEAVYYNVDGFYARTDLIVGNTVDISELVLQGDVKDTGSVFIYRNGSTIETVAGEEAYEFHKVRIARGHLKTAQDKLTYARTVDQVYFQLREQGRLV